MDNLSKQSVPTAGVAAAGRGMTTTWTTCLLVWLVCAASLTSVAGEWTHYCGTERSERYIAQGRCGSQLAETLSVVCRMFGGYNSRSFGKRAAVAASPPTSSLASSPTASLAAAAAAARAVSSATNAKPRRQHGELDTENGPFWSKSKALSYLQINKRVIVTRNGQAYRQGIVCECCMHRCSLGELYEYCADPSYTVTKRGNNNRWDNKNNGHAPSSSHLPVDTQVPDTVALLQPPPGGLQSLTTNQTGFVGLNPLEENRAEGERYLNGVREDDEEEEAFGLRPEVLDTGYEDTDHDDSGYEEQLKREGAVAEQLAEVRDKTDSLLQQILRLGLKQRLQELGQGDQPDRK